MGSYPWIMAMLQPDPLPGSYLNHGETIDRISEKLLEEAAVLDQIGYEGFVLQNMHDGPIRQHAQIQTIAYMTRLAVDIRQAYPKKKLGILVNWDGAAALAIADAAKADFVRIEHLYTGVSIGMCGFVEGQCAEVLELKKKLGTSIPVYADVQEVNGNYLNPLPKEKEALRTIRRAFADGLFTSGNTKQESLAIATEIKRRMPEVPLFLGGKATADNVEELLEVYDGVSVASWIKDGDMRNPINQEKARRFYENAAKVAKRGL